MTTNDLRPGCFGSALIYRAGAEECVRCAHGPECAQTVAQRIPSVTQTLLRLDTKFKMDRARPTARWMKAKMREQVRQTAKADAHAQAILDGLSAAGVNVYHLRHKTNPMQSGSPLHLIFEAMLRYSTFKPRDLFEAIIEQNPRLKRGQLQGLIKNTCNALLLAGVLKKERGVLCLT